MKYQLQMPAPWDLEYECLIHERMREAGGRFNYEDKICLLYTSPSPRDRQKSRMPSSA